MQTFNRYKYDNNTQTLTIGRFVSVGDFDIDSLTEFDIEYIKVDEKNSDFIVEDNVLFNENGDIILCFPNKDKREKYIVPDSVKYISRKAFYGTDNLKKVAMNDNVKDKTGKEIVGCRRHHLIIDGKKIINSSQPCKIRYYKMSSSVHILDIYTLPGKKQCKKA